MKTKVTRFVQLELNGEEAEWLTGYLQNFHGEGHETEDHFQTRRGFFEALKKALEGQKS